VSVLEKSGLIQSDSPINAVTVTGEALKLLFNLMLVESRMGDSSVAEKFEACLVPIFHILYVVPAPEPLPLSPPHSHAVHALMQYPYEITSKMWKQQKEWTRTMYSTVEEGHEFITHVFIDFLDRSLRHLIPEGDPDNCSNAQVDAILSPLLLVIRNLADAEVSFRTIFASHMLPTKE
jgi:hypothetical protein